jgi:DNA invertase Pin-like site-specific DNA recombinase
MAVYGYVRVSTAKQVNEGESLEVQERKLRAWGDMHDTAVDDVFVDEGVSGSTRLGERLAGSNMLASLKTGDTIVATKLDRMFRSSLDALQTVKDMQRRKIKIHIIELGDITGNGVAKVFMTIAAAFAEFEREQIAERVSDVKRDQRARGRYLGGKVPFGFRISDQIDPDGSRHQVLTLVETDHEMIREIRQLRGQGQTFRQIQSHLETEHRRKLALATIKRVTDEAA